MTNNWSQGQSSAQRISRSERAEQALSLRKAGLTYKEIGRRMGFTEQRAYHLVTQELARLNQQRAEAAEAVSRLELERLDRLLAAIWDKAQAGDFGAIDRVLSIMARRARLLGIDLEKTTTPSVSLNHINVNAKLSDHERALAIQSILARVGQPDPGPAPAGADDAAGQVLDHTGSVADGCGAGAGPLADDVPPLFGT